ncbi:MAG: hypothetical protein NTX88_01630 [Candidatus Atribacteria bacterium]|nr:hypothetical protein [Candidatus Atribacteria bacterium]
MRKFFLIFILIMALGSSVAINAEEKQDFEWSFHDLLGWNTNFMLQGQTPATVFYLPAPPTHPCKQGQKVVPSVEYSDREILENLWNSTAAWR